MDVFAGYGFDVWTMDFEGYGRSSPGKGNSNIADGVANLERGQTRRPVPRSIREAVMARPFRSRCPRGRGFLRENFGIRAAGLRPQGERQVRDVSRDRRDPIFQEPLNLFGRIGGPGMHRQARAGRLSEQRRRDEIAAGTDAVDRREKWSSLARLGQRYRVVEEEARGYVRIALAQAAQEVGGEGGNQAAIGDSVFGREPGDPAW